MQKANRKLLNEIDIIKGYIGVFDPAGMNSEFRFSESIRHDNVIKHQTKQYSICFQLKNDIKENNLKLSSGTLFSFFFGEIYNFDELCDTCSLSEAEKIKISNSDLCEILYKNFGLSFASRINGFFSIIIIDKNSFYLIADRFSSARPIYYSVTNKICFGSNLKNLLKCNDIGRNIDEHSLAVFLKYSYIPAPRSIIKGIKKLCPGEILIYKNNNIKTIRYIDFEPKKEHAYSEKEAIEKYIDLLGMSIQQKMEGFEEKRVGYFLSGGLDSSANVALASINGYRNFNTFGIGFENNKIDERPYARIVAKHFGVNFYDYTFDGSEIEDLPNIIWHLDEPFMENGLFLTYAGFKAAKNSADLIVAGDGADQLFGTGGFAGGRPIALMYLFDKYHLKLSVEKLRKVLHRRAYAYKDNLYFKTKVLLDRSLDFNDWFFWGFDNSELEHVCNFSINKEIIKCFSNNIRKIPKTLSDYYKQALIHQDIEHYVCQNVLVKSFRMAELFNKKIRETYLDNNIINFNLNLNYNLLTKGNLISFFTGSRITKYLHRISMEGILPGEVLKKPKQGGFVPMSILLSEDKKREKIFRYILRSEIVKNYLNKSFVETILTKYSKSIGKKNYWYSYQDSKVNKIMNILALSLWYDLILKNSSNEGFDLTLSKVIE